MNKPLLILPFDHRGSFKKLINSENPTKITELKTLIFAGFIETTSKYKNKNYFGILVDEEFGTPIIKKAKTLGINIAVPVEKSGENCFDFEYGKNFKEHIEKFDPTFVKVLVRYNPSNTNINPTQLERLKKLSDYCQETNRNLLFELLVPPTDADLETVDGNKELYDTNIRPTKTLDAIKEIKEKVHVTTWKLEWFKKEIWKKILNAIEPESNVIVLGRGDSAAHVKKWLTDAGNFEKVIGFAVGRTTFVEPLTSFIKGEISKKEAVTQIGNNYNNLVQLWFDLKKLV